MNAEIKEQLLKLTLQDIVELVQEKKMMESKAVHPNARRTLGKIEVVIRPVTNTPLQLTINNNKYETLI